MAEKPKRKLPPETVSKQTDYLRDELFNVEEPDNGPWHQCQCGYRTRLVDKIRQHCLNGSRIEGAGTHRKTGMVNDAGEPVVEEVVDEHEGNPPGSNGKKPVADKTRQAATEKLTKDTSNLTNDLSRAQAFRFSPKIFTCDFTPVMRAAREAVTNEWGWQQDMPFEEFIDRIFLTFFKDRGITLPGYGYIVEETPEETQPENISQEITGHEAETMLVGSLNI